MPWVSGKFRSPAGLSVAPGGYPAEAPETHVVQRGDTLWDIAGTFLRDPWFWPEIWYVNPDVFNPHLIYPGDVLALVYIDGQPRITTARGSSLRLSPQARVTPLSEAVTSISYESIAAFLKVGAIIEKRDADRADRGRLYWGYLVAMTLGSLGVVAVVSDPIRLITVLAAVTFTVLGFWLVVGVGLVALRASISVMGATTGG